MENLQKFSKNPAKPTDEGVSSRQIINVVKTAFDPKMLSEPEEKSVALLVSFKGWASSFLRG